MRHNPEDRSLSLGFEPTISAGGRPQNYALDRAANGTGITLSDNIKSRPCKEDEITYVESLYDF